jgi:tetratricopeptide (TPR) repeat protein
VPAEYLQLPKTELMIRFTDKTLGTLEAAIKLNELPVEKPSVNSFMQRAEADKAENPASALKIYEEAIEAYPEDANLLNSAAWFLVTTEAKQLRDPKRALVWARKAVQLTQEQNGFILDTLAVALHEDGQLEEAARIQQRAAELSPNDEIVQRAKSYAEELKSQK